MCCSLSAVLAVPALRAQPPRAAIAGRAPRLCALGHRPDRQRRRCRREPCRQSGHHRVARTRADDQRDHHGAGAVVPGDRPLRARASQAATSACTSCTRPSGRDSSGARSPGVPPCRGWWTRWATSGPTSRASTSTRRPSRPASRPGRRYARRSTQASTSRTWTRTWARCSTTTRTSSNTARWRRSSSCRSAWAPQETLAAFGGGHQRAQLDADGVVYPDYLIHGGRLKDEPIDVYWRRMLEGLRPGVTELYIHAALPGEEMQAVTNSWKDRAAEFELFTNDASIRALLEAQGRQAHRLSRAARSAAEAVTAVHSRAADAEMRSITVKVVGPPGGASRANGKPWPARISWTIVRPMPCPPSLVLKNGVNRCVRTSSDRPGPCPRSRSRGRRRDAAPAPSACRPGRSPRARSSAR